MQFTAISDTHGQHSQLSIPPGDVLIHAGDISRNGKQSQVFDFLHWFAQLPFEHKIFIAGNHDFYFEVAPEKEIKKMIPAGVTYLNDSSITIKGIKIWGSPVTPWFYQWAFNRRRGAEIQKHWALIDRNADVIITHGPVYGILDKTVNKDNAGCADLLQTVTEIKPKWHVCGHIHEGYGIKQVGPTTFANVSVLNEKYELVNKPVVFEM